MFPIYRLMFPNASYVSNIRFLFPISNRCFQSKMMFPNDNVSNVCFQYTWSHYSSTFWGVLKISLFSGEMIQDQGKSGWMIQFVTWSIKWFQTPKLHSIRFELFFNSLWNTVFTHFPATKGQYEIFPIAPT